MLHLLHLLLPLHRGGIGLWRGKGTPQVAWIRAPRGSAWVLVLATPTVTHALLRLGFAGQAPQSPRLVSSLRVGQVMPDPAVASLGAERGPSTLLLPGVDCQLVVAFDPACGHCRSAARNRRGAALRGAVPATWVAAGFAQEVAAFRDALPLQDRVVWATGALDALEVDAVPAAFLVNGHGTISRVGPLSGREEEEELLASCRDPATPVKPGRGTAFHR